MAALTASVIIAAVTRHYNDSFSSELLWPPTRQSAPFLIAITSAIAILLVISFGKRNGNDEARVREMKKKLIAAQLAEAMRWNSKESHEEHDENHEAEQKEKRPPESSELFEMLFDDVEERHVTNFGISVSDPDYSGCLDLFKQRLQPDLEEAARCTRISRSLVAPSAEDLSHADDPKRVALFKDGTKLKEYVTLYDKKIIKHFGKDLLLPAASINDAKATLKAMERSQRQGAFTVLYALFKPEVPLYLVSLALMAFDSYTGPRTFHAMATALDGVADGSLSIGALQASLGQTYVKLILCVFAHLTSWALTHKVTGRFSNAVRIEVLKGILRQDTVFFDVNPSGVIQERLNNDAQNLSSKLFHLPIHVVSSCLRMVTNSMAIYQMRPELLLYCIAPIPVMALLQKVFIGFMERMHERGRKVSEHVVASTNEMVKELRTVRSFAMEHEEAETYNVNCKYRSSIQEWTSVIHHVCFIAPLVLMFFAVRISALFLGGTYIVSGMLTVGMAVQLGASADELQHNMRSLMELIPEFIQVRGPIGRICDAINTRPTIEPYPGEPAKCKSTIKGHIEFRDVGFTFPSEPQKQILFGLSFVAAPGEKVAFVGPTGCGKSTALQIIQRFYNQTSGEVLLDGRPIGDYDVHHLRRQVSVVAQENVLFSTTIRENIVYGLPKARRDKLTNEDVERVCRKANAWDFICGFPRKLETYCGEKGVKLSGGQKQRLAIARALIREPTICLLDEATAALDSKTEEVVQAALDQMIEESSSGCTIVIAHRLSTIKNCDRIMCMQKGVLLESGTHEDLVDKPIVKGADGKSMVSGLYADLWETQMGGGGKSAVAAKEKPHAAVADLMGEVAELRKRNEKYKALLAVANASLEAHSPEARSRALRREVRVDVTASRRDSIDSLDLSLNLKSFAREASTSSDSPSASTSDEELEEDEEVIQVMPPKPRRFNSA